MDIKPITDPEVTDFMDSFYRPLSPVLEEIRVEAEADRIPVLRRETETFLRTLLTLQRPRSILEIGAAVGYSASLFATVCPDAHVTTIESDAYMASCARNNTVRACVSDRIEIIEGDARETASLIEGIFDFAFIDASKSHYREFWDAVVGSIRPAGIIVCDNILMAGRTVSETYDPMKKFRTSRRKMREFLEYITNLDNVTTSLITSADGLSVSVINPL